MTWPSPQMANACRDAWLKSSPEQRSFLTSMTCNAVVLYLRIAEKMLVARSSKEDETEGRSRFRLADLEWSMEHPRLLLLSPAVCEADDAMDFMLGLCLATTDECLELVQQAKSGRVGFDAETNALVSGRSSTWEQHARDFWTLVVHDICLHMESSGSHARCIRNVKSALTKPVSSPTRSWPNKKTFSKLKESWARLDVAERVRMTTLSTNEYWFIQACDICLASGTLVACKKSSLGVDLPLLKSLRERSKIISNLEVNVDAVVRIMMSSAFVMDPRCLEELYSKAARQVTEKADLVRMALCYRYDGLLEEGSPALVANSTSNWTDMERVVATLVLECMLQRFALMSKAADFVTQYNQDAELKAYEAAERKRDKRQEKKRAAREMQMALTRAEQERELAELSRQKAEETRRAAEAERAKAEELRVSQEEARVLSEMERRLYEEWRAEQRKEERQKTLEMLAKAPSWDISFLRVTRTFLDYHEPEMSLFAVKDW